MTTKIAEGYDVVPCIIEHKHLSSRRHSREQCPAEHEVQEPEPTPERTFTYVVTQRVRYYEGVEFANPSDLIAWVQEGGEWDTKANEVESDRIQVYEDGKLVGDTELGD